MPLVAGVVAERVVDRAVRVEAQQHYVGVRGQAARGLGVVLGGAGDDDLAVRLHDDAARDLAVLAADRHVVHDHALVAEVRVQLADAA